MVKKSKNFLGRILPSILSGLLNVHADMSTAVTTGSGFKQMTDLQRAVYSKEIEFKALPVMRFYQFAKTKTELGKIAGATIKMLTYDNLSLGGKLTEGTHMTTQSLSTSMKDITVAEFGNAVKVSELLLVTSFDDVISNATTLLGRDYAQVLDCQLRDTALKGTNHIYARKSDGSIVSSRATLDETCIFKVSTVKDAIEVLATNNAPKVEGNYWICFVHPHQSRSLRDDSAWINASNYGAPEQLFTGEIGRIDDCRFIETTLMCNGAAPEKDPAYVEALKKGQDNSATNVYQSVIFGDSYYAVAFGLNPELRDNGIEDYGREHGIAWYSIFGTEILNDEHGVVIETA